MPLIDLNGLGHFKDKENAMIAEKFSASKAYAVGDYCYYNGTLYRFKTAHAAGAWTTSDVEAAKLAHDVSDLKESINNIEPVAYAGVEQKTITDVPIASFDDGADDVPVKKLVVDIEPVQSGTGDPSPDNIRPITGWTICNIYHSGEDTSNPTVIPIAFPSEAGTVYGGNLEINEDGSGTLTVDRLGLDMGSLSWQYTGESAWFCARTTALPYAPYRYAQGQNPDKASCSIYPVFVGNSATLNAADKVITVANIALSGVYGIIVKDTTYTSLADFKPSVANQTVVYELATPQVYSFTAHQVKTLLGLNNIWADTGDIAELTYRAMNNTSAMIALTKALIAPVLDSMTADTALAVNDFRIVGNTLYRVTAPIASGGTLTVGTNVVATTIGAQITELLNA